MDYPEYRRQGLPVTTAWMESLVKEVNYRVKGTEMFWNDPEGAEAILQVRAAALCDDERLVSSPIAREPFHPSPGIPQIDSTRKQKLTCTQPCWGTTHSCDVERMPGRPCVATRNRSATQGSRISARRGTKQPGRGRRLNRPRQILVFRHCLAPSFEAQGLKGLTAAYRPRDGYDASRRGPSKTSDKSKSTGPRI